MSDENKDIYKHYKGDLYEFLNIGIMENDGSKVVVYKSINSGIVYVRPFKEFYQKFKYDHTIGKLKS